ncbi:O-antigen ligase family protein [Patescibacteria group bacterium]|jgi:O-antigen ligase|nr:O-antigen ligase family protein [Patescibacteria group bacterium]
MNRANAIRLFKALTYLGIYGGLLLPLIFIPTVIFPFVFSKLIAFQVLIGLTFPAYVALAWMDPEYRPRKHMLYLAILAYFGALTLSVIFAIDPLRAWWGNQERMNGLFTLLHFLAWLTMAVGTLKTWDQWKKLLNYQVALSCIMAIVAIMQKFNPNLLMFPAGPRVGGLLDNPIYMASYQIFNFFFLALLFWRNKSTAWRIGYAVIAVFDIIAFVLAQSRGALVGLGVGIVAFAFYVGLFHPSKKTKAAVFGGLLALMLAYGGLFAMRDLPIIKNSPLERLTNFQTTVTTRIIAWEIAWQGFLERPITGWGLDNFHIVFNNHFNPESLRYGAYETWFDRAHNTVMDVLSMTGIIGFITFFAIYVAIFLSTWQAYKKKWIDLPIAAILFSLPIAYFVQNLFVFDHPAGFSMSYLLFALIIAATKGEFIGERDPAAVKEKKDEGRRDAPWIMFAVLQIAAILVVYRTSILPFRASVIALRANGIINYNPAQGYELAKQASEIPTMYKDEQSFLLSRNLIGIIGGGNFPKVPKGNEMYDLAKALSQEEISRHPHNTHPLYIYARLAQEMMSQRPTEAAVALESYQKAIATSPKRQQLHYGLARLYLQLGRLDDAIAVFKTVRDFDLENGIGYWNYGVTMLYDKGSTDEAARQIGAEEVRKAMQAKWAYVIQDSRELFPLFDAYIILRDAENLQKTIENLQGYPLATANIYAQLAMKMQVLGLTELRDQILTKAETLAPGTKDEYDRMLDPQDSDTVTLTPAPEPTNTVATSAGSGPRR